MKTEKIIKLLSETVGISGYEGNISKVVSELFEEYCDEIKTDALGNLICFKKGKGKNSIMLAAHMDEIGLMVKDIDKNGFIKFVSVGGIDERTLLCQEVLVHGRKALFGVIGTKPPHIVSAKERKESIKIEDLSVDVGYSKEELNGLVEIGDVISFKKDITTLKNGRIAGKSIDDRAGVAVMLECLKELKRQDHDLNIYCVSTVQEEVTMSGAIASTYNIEPDLGIAIDVGHGKIPDTKDYETSELGKGPAVTTGPNIHPSIFKQFKTTAKSHYIDYQIEIAEGHSGTDAWQIQISKSGVATGLLSIPLRYMHTSVETLDISDIKKTAKLLAHFIMDLNDKDMEDFLCY
ncbi:MAG: M42 family metallopeptidase [Alkaliphilus sp.]